MSDEWTIEVFEADDGTEPYARFVASLSPIQRAALNAAVKHLLAPLGLGLAGSEWIKPLGAGLHEFRIRHNASEIESMFGGQRPEPMPAGERILLRVFVHFYGQRVVLLLGGYDKGNDPSERKQRREIAVARKLLIQFRERQRRERSKRRRRTR